MRLTFLGGAGEVTGSSLLVETSRCRFLVDAGMFQGGRDTVRKNRAAAARDLGRLDFVVLTHAHLDHSGLLPAVRLGPRVPVLCTAPTADLLEPMLRDSAHIQAGNGARRRPLPLYDVPDVERVLARLQRLRYGTVAQPHADVQLELHDAGHILGAAWARLTVRDGARTRTLVCSGDLGDPGAPLVRDRVPYPGSELLVLESTYGDRDHRARAATEDELVAVLQQTLHERGGNVVVPAFAVGRTQELLVLLYRLARAGRVRVPLVVVDSPLAQRAGEITFRHLEALDPEAREFAQAAAARRLPFVLRLTETPQQSMALQKVRGGAVIVAASGMCEAGRIRHHLARHLPRPEHAVLFVGYQAIGTLGRQLVDGARSVSLFGARVPVRARLHTINGLSAHAGQASLLDWARGARAAPARTWVNHGEPAAAHALTTRLIRELQWHAEVAAPGTPYTV